MFLKNFNIISLHPFKSKILVVFGMFLTPVINENMQYMQTDGRKFEKFEQLVLDKGVSKMIFLLIIQH